MPARPCLFLPLLTALALLAPAALLAQPPNPWDYHVIVGSITLDGAALTQADTGISVAVVRADGSAYSPAAEDKDGLDANGDFRMNVPMGTAFPGQALEGEAAVVKMWRNGRAVWLEDSALLIGEGGGARRFDLSGLVNTPPNADAGLDLFATEGNTARLDGSGSQDPDGRIVEVLWTQTGGPAAVLDTPGVSSPAFAAPPVTGNAVLTFRLTVTDNEGAQDTEDVSVTVSENGITGFPAFVSTFLTATGVPMGVSVTGGSLTGLDALGGESVAGSGKPSQTPLGLVDLTVLGGAPGFTATVSLYLDSPAPAGWRWYKATARDGWRDVSALASYSAARDIVEFTWEDGGEGDDGPVDGRITDPLGPGFTPAAQAAASGGGGGGGGGGCFVDTLGAAGMQ
jgi:hypothetical protein